nr:hypothetical protein [Tanacetum cinerariifolium]
MVDWLRKGLQLRSKAAHLKRSRSSKVNRSKQLYSSNQETKSYAQSRFEEETGEFPNLIDHFRVKHMKGGKWNSLVAEERYFNEETSEFPNLIDHFRVKHMKGGKWNSLVAEERYLSEQYSLHNKYCVVGLMHDDQFFIQQEASANFSSTFLAMLKCRYYVGIKPCLVHLNLMSFDYVCFSTG